jgi:hypothetical protein
MDLALDLRSYGVVVFLCMITFLILYYCWINLTRHAILSNKFPWAGALPFIGNYNHLMCPPQGKRLL